MEIVRIIITGFIAVFTSYVVGLIGIHLRSRKHNLQLKQLKISIIVFGIGIMLFLLCAATIIIVLFKSLNEENIIYSIGYFLFMCLSLWIIMYSLNWQIVIKENTFIFRNIFRKEKEYSYSDIKKIIPTKMGGYKIYLKNKKISIDILIKDIGNLSHLITKHKKLLNSNK